MFFVASKLAWLLLSPMHLAIVAAIVAAALLFTRWWRAGRLVVLALGLLGLAILVLPVDDWALRPLEARFPPPALPAAVDGIIVLGGGFAGRVSDTRHRPELDNAGDRNVALAVLARRYPEARLVYSGGPGMLFEPGGGGGEWIGPFLASLGIGVGRLTVEDRSRNTRQNALFARELVAPAPGSRWILVTSANHLPRAVGCFRHLGWDVIPYPVDYRLPDSRPEWITSNAEQRLVRLSLAFREWIGLITYRAIGYTDSLLPGPASPPPSAGHRPSMGRGPERPPEGVQ